MRRAGERQIGDLRRHDQPHDRGNDENSNL
jgi:hypothetical protein